MADSTVNTGSQSSNNPTIVEGRRRIDVDIVGGNEYFLSKDYQSQITRNMYEVQSQDGLTQKALFPMPGTTLFTTLSAGPVRGLYQVNNVVYGVAGQSFFIINSDGTFNVFSNVINPTGDITFVANNSGGTPTQIMVSDGNGNGFIYSTTLGTFTPIDDPDFLGSGRVTMLNEFAIFNIPGTNEFQCSDADNFASYSGSGGPNIASVTF